MLKRLSFQCCCYTVPMQLARATRRLILRLNRLRAHAHNLQSAKMNTQD